MPHDDYYPEPDDQAPMEDDAEESVSETESENTALLPKSLFAGHDFNPGDELRLKIVKAYEDEVEVSYAAEPKPNRTSAEDEIRSAAMEEPEMMPAGGMMGG